MAEHVWSNVVGGVRVGMGHPHTSGEGLWAEEGGGGVHDPAPPELGCSYSHNLGRVGGGSCRPVEMVQTLRDLWG